MVNPYSNFPHSKPTVQSVVQASSMGSKKRLRAQALLQYKRPVVLVTKSSFAELGRHSKESGRLRCKEPPRLKWFATDRKAAIECDIAAKLMGPRCQLAWQSYGQILERLVLTRNAMPAKIQYAPSPRKGQNLFTVRFLELDEFVKNRPAFTLSFLAS
jgi:hypothetical protein